MLNKMLKKRNTCAIKYSFVFQSYDMKKEVVNTLLSVLPSYQDYPKECFEVILVENPSKNTLSTQDLEFYAGNLVFIKNEINTPITISLNNAIRQARGEFLVICVDAARILSDGILKYCDQALRLAEKSIAAFHGFHLGIFPQQMSVDNGLYSKEDEMRFLEDIRFPNNPKALFCKASWAGSSSAGYFFQMAESNCLMIPRKSFYDIGGFDERLDSLSGGLANLDLYNRALSLTDHKLFFVLGEGTFHQFHNGDTTSGEKKFEKYVKEYRDKTGNEWQFPSRRDYEYLGHVPYESLSLIKQSAVKAIEVYSIARPPVIVKNINEALTSKIEELPAGVDLIEVFAMHRSKSSFIASMLVESIQGRIPGNVLGKLGSSNPKGHFEPHEIVVLHNRILNEFGQSWRSISPLDLYAKGKDYFEYCVDRVAKVLSWGVRSSFSQVSVADSGPPSFIVKDPRMCRLSQIWDALVFKCGCASKRIVLIDHPTKVANSLYKRNALPKEWGELLWLRYNLDILMNLRAEDLLVNLHVETGDMVKKRLQEYIGVEMKSTSELRANPFIEPETEIAEIFDDYCRNGDIDKIKMELMSIEQFIRKRSNMFNHIDNLMREVS